MGTASGITSASLSSFNGTSTYAADLQKAITQAVTIASIPLDQVENNLNVVGGESSELSTLQADFTTLQTAIQNLSTATGTGALAGTVSDTTVASVSVDSSAALAAGTYTLNVISAGSSTSTLSSAGLSTVSDPSSTSISTSSSFTLSVSGTDYQISPATNTLNALAQAINSSGAAVSATVVNIGPSSAPDYRLSIQSTSLGDQSIQLNDGSQPLLTVLSDGTPATYQVDGQPSTPISSDSSTVTLGPGVTVDLLGTGQTTVTVAADSSPAATALSSFATAYNAALTELGNNHGTAGGPLTGQGVIFDLGQSLQNLTQFSGGTGSVKSLADLGLTFSASGQLSFNQAKFESVSSSDPQDVSNFLGSATGGGFLQNATNLLNGLEDINSGLFTTTNNSFQSQITADNQEISDQEARITTLQNNLTAQMTQADALIASLQSQDTYLTTLFADTQNVTSSNH
jgi:flagellar hook-associated protein 2